MVLPRINAHRNNGWNSNKSTTELKLIELQHYNRIMAEDFDIEAYLDAQIAATKEKK